MPERSKARVAMPTQDPDVRCRNFQEVALGYNEAQAVAEARRCLDCKNRPCMAGCPVQVDIPSFIRETARGHFDQAYDIVAKTNALPAVCGRVCPQESQCERKCVCGIKGEPVAIGRLERFIADRHNARNTRSSEADAQPVTGDRSPTGRRKVAVVGSGPSGLACAGDLARKGYDVTIFEALHLAGGVLVYGIPEFRLPKSIVQREIEGLVALGVRIETNRVIGKTLSVDDLMSAYGFESVFVGSGAGLPQFMDIPGENLKGVYSANEFLTRINLMKAYEADSRTPVQKVRNVIVVGGGNVAMDAARCARRLGAEVTVVYRRTEKELPARAEEVEHAREEGIRFLFLTSPVRIAGDANGWVCSVICQEMILGQPDETGRARAIPLYESQFPLEADCVIMAIGTTPNPLIKQTTSGLTTHRWGGIVVDEATGQTSRPGVFAGGDAVTGAATVILAMGAGKTAAAAIDRALQGG